MNRNDLYRFLVNKNPEIRRRYLEFRRYHGSVPGKYAGWLLLLIWNIQYWAGGGKYMQERPSRLLLQESALDKDPTATQLLGKLCSYEVVSFDVFDTLLVRPFQNPSDLFYFLGIRLGYPNFQHIRIQAEEKARREAIEKGKGEEVTLEEIWEVVSRETGLEKETGLRAEWELEQQCCFPSLRLLRIVRELKSQGKILVAASDMYLEEWRVRKLLSQAGYQEFDQVFVSASRGKSKHSGTLYREIRKRYPETASCIHVGDDLRTDRYMARKCGWDAVWLPSAQDLGRKYRIRDMSPLIGAMYHGVANLRLHGTQLCYDPLYEFGYLYGGILALGYCGYIRRISREKHLDRILFLARDGAILREVYGLLYPNEDTRYVYWSRKVALKVVSGERRWDFFQRFLRDKAGQGYSVSECFRSMGLEELMEELLAAGIHGNDRMTRSCAEFCEQVLQKNWRLIQNSYRKEQKAAEMYVEELLQDAKAAAVVDIGWAGTGGRALSDIAQKAAPHCRIYSLVAGTSPQKSGDGDCVGASLFSGELYAYLFSPSFNRDLWKQHDPEKGHNLYLEMLFTSTDPSLTGIRNDQAGNLWFEFGKQEMDPEKLLQIRKGVLDFVKDWKKYFEWMGDTAGKISGSDAYRPLAAALSDRQYLKLLKRYFSWNTNWYVE